MTDKFAAISTLNEVLNTVPLLYKQGQAVAMGQAALQTLYEEEQPIVLSVYDTSLEPDNAVTIKCPCCSHAFVSFGFKYCPYCGRLLPDRMKVRTGTRDCRWVTRDEENETYRMGSK